MSDGTQGAIRQPGHFGSGTRPLQGTSTEPAAVARIGAPQQAVSAGGPRGLGSLCLDPGSPVAARPYGATARSSIAPNQSFRSSR